MRLTASALPRAAVCPGSVVLPQVGTTTEDQEAGLDNHATLESAVVEDRLEALPEEIRTLIPEGAVYAAELSVAYDPVADTARRLGFGLGRRYPVTGSEIGGTIDLLIEPGRDRATVVDYKRHDDVGSPDENEQTMFYGLAAARFNGLDEMRLVIAYVDKDQDGDVVLKRPLVSSVVDSLDLEAFVHRLRWIIERVDEQRGKPFSDVDVVESKYCRGCGAFDACPAKTALGKRLLNGGEEQELDLLLPLNEETAPRMWERLGHIKHYVKRYERSLYAFSRDRPFKLPNGRVVGQHVKVGNEVLDDAVVHAVVSERLGIEVAAKAVIYGATKKRLLNAVREAGVPKPTKAAEAILVEIRKRGGATRKWEQDVGEFQPSEEK